MQVGGFMSLIEVPKPNTKFLQVVCKCKNKQIVFSNPAVEVKCSKCGEILAKPSSGKAVFFGRIEKEMN